MLQCPYECLLSISYLVMKVQWSAPFLRLRNRDLWMLDVGNSLVAGLVAQLVKNLSAMRETWVWSQGWDDPMEKGTATHSTVLAWKIPRTVHGVAKSRTQMNDFHFLSFQWLGGQGSIPGVGWRTGRGERASTTKMPYPTCCVVQPKQTSK